MSYLRYEIEKKELRPLVRNFKSIINLSQKQSISERELSQKLRKECKLVVIAKNVVRRDAIDVTGTEI